MIALEAHTNTASDPIEDQVRCLIKALDPVSDHFGVNLRNVRSAIALASREKRHVLLTLLDTRLAELGVH